MKSELPAHLQHRGVLLQHLAFDAFELLAARIADDEIHELPSDAVALEVRAHQDGIFGALVIGIRVQPDDAEQVSGRDVERREGDRPAIIQLRQAREEGVRMANLRCAGSLPGEACPASALDSVGR